MIPKLLFALLVCFCWGFVVVSLIWPGRLRAGSTVLRCSLAFGFGCGISACWFFWWLCLAGASDAYFSTFVLPELAITVGLWLAYFRYYKERGQLTSNSAVRSAGDKDLAARLFPAIFYGVLACAIISFVLISLKNPHGEYDAMSTWNLRARFLARGTAHWRDAFVDSRGHSHANLDYPLLLPSTVATLWKYTGYEPVVVPSFVAFLFTFSSAGLVCSALTFLRNKRIGYLGGIVLLSVYPFIKLGTWQYADVVVGFFMLSAIAIMSLYDASPTSQSRGFLALVGATAGFCAWTKNEGMLFLFLVLMVRFYSSLSRGGWRMLAKEAAAIASGLLPVLAVLAYFKLAVAPANSWVTHESYSASHPIRYFLEPGTIGQKLTSPSRYWLIAKSMASEIVHFGARTVGITPFLLLYLLSAKPRRKSIMSVMTGATLLALMLTGYFCVYLTTPLNLAFHLATSLSRLLLQLWPSAVFVFFMATSTADPGTSQPCDQIAAIDSGVRRT